MTLGLAHKRIDQLPPGLGDQLFIRQCAGDLIVVPVSLQQSGETRGANLSTFTEKIIWLGAKHWF
ncbi:MAG: hypothetical protein JW757_02270 [Anaerolineales bacterium]|nr:hypothetical protein [Anaerolineales bacterium]